jgi:hypothetical protein
MPLTAALAAYEGPRGIPHVTDAQAGLGQTGRGAAKEERRGSRGGAPIWVCWEAYMPRGQTSPERLARLHARRDAGAVLHPGEIMELAEHGDVDGFAVFGRFPKGWLRHILKLELLGPVKRDELLHVCSGTLGPEERWTVDLRLEANPRVVANGTALPFRNSTFRAVLLDPPYSDQYARNLYGTENPRPSWLLKEAARVVVPSGHVGILHVAVPFAPPNCRLVACWGVTTGVGFRIRCLTVYQKAQEELAL